LFDRFVPKLKSAFQIAISDIVDNAVLKDFDRSGASEPDQYCVQTVRFSPKLRCAH
jgi:hypothetical protein